jgi:hypothetical protein
MYDEEYFALVVNLTLELLDRLIMAGSLFTTPSVAVV